MPQTTDRTHQAPVIPADVRGLECFRRWCYGPTFPEGGRIDFLAGDIEVDMSPEDLYTHGMAKTAIAAGLHALVVDTERGAVFTDRTRVTSSRAGLSAEPDVVVVLWQSLAAGRVHEVPAQSGTPGRYVELEGAPDLVVEILSDSSTRKDTLRLPSLYAQAGVPELWLVDARGDELIVDARRLHRNRYQKLDKDPEGWFVSPFLGCSLRLLRYRVREARWRYRLEHRRPPAT